MKGFTILNNSDTRVTNKQFDFMDSIIVAIRTGVRVERKYLLFFKRAEIVEKTELYRGHFLFHSNGNKRLYIMQDGVIVEIETIGRHVVYYSPCKVVLFEKKRKSVMHFGKLKKRQRDPHSNLYGMHNYEMKKVKAPGRFDKNGYYFHI